MPNIGIISLNSGKLTPLIDARSDIEKYPSGCRILENAIPLIYGPVTRRPGTKYIANVNDNDVKSKIVSFIFSATIAYNIEFGNQVMNVYFDETAVDTNITSPYLEADLFQLHFEQSADVMWITHSDYQPRKFSRVSATEFTLDTIPFTDGPFRERNDIAEDDGVTITVTGLAIASATAGASGAGIFTITSVTDISSLFPLNQRFYVTDSTGNDKAYTVLTATFAALTLTITPNEAVVDGTNDGQIMVDDGTVTLTASAATFTTGSSGHIDSLWKLTHKRLQTVTKGTATATGVIGEAIDVKGAWTFTTTGNWGAVIEVQRNADGTNWETFRTYVSTLTDGRGSFNAQKSDVEADNGVQYRINVTEYTSGTVEANLLVDKSTQDSIYKITAVASTTSATATALVAAPDSTAATRWAEGSWSHVRGWPATITFFEERAVYGFTNQDQQDVWLSKSGKFETFEAGILDADSFALRLPTANRGRWLGSLETLAAGTSGDEWRIRASAIDQALTPTNFEMRKQTQHGSTDMQSLEVNEAILFIDFVARKVREYTFSDPRQKYVAPDLTALAEDITLGGITSAAVQRNPDSIVWFTISNSPYLISLTYEREQNVVAWAQHPLGGSGIAESVSVIPGTTEDVITLTVKRTIDGSTVRFIEQMQPRNFGSTTDPTNAFFVDAGIVDTGGTITITGLSHLEGETVTVFVDGAVQANKTVSGGQITIDESGSRAVVGLSSAYRISPMRPDLVTRLGTTHGIIAVTPEIILSLFVSGGVEYGNGSNQKAIDFRTTEDYDSPPNLFTGDTDALVFDGGFNKDMDIVISGDGPLPCTLRAIILKEKVTGR